MRRHIAFSAPVLLGLSMLAPPVAQAQGAPPRGSYERLCTDIRMNGIFLSATCRGARGPAASSINTASCASDIGVDAEGGLTCTGPGAAQPQPRPGYSTNPYPPNAGYPQPRPGRPYDDGRPGRPYDDVRPGRPYDDGHPGRPYDDGRPGRPGRDAITLFSGRNLRGEAVPLDGPMANLARTGLNDRVRSIQLDRRSGPWVVCSDADFRGRCVTITRSVQDTRDIGLDRAISSLRPAR